MLCSLVPTRWLQLQCTGRPHDPALPPPLPPSGSATVDDSLPFIANILLACCASLAGVAAVLCLTQASTQELGAGSSAPQRLPGPAALPTPAPARPRHPPIQPLVLVLLPPLAMAYRRLQRFYRATSRELRRLASVATSPVYTAFAGAQGWWAVGACGADARRGGHRPCRLWVWRIGRGTICPRTPLAEALSGGPTIRAFGAQLHFLAAAEAAVAAQQRASVASAAAGSWLGLRLQLMAAVLAALVAVAAVAEHARALPWSHSGAGAAAHGDAGSSGGGMAAGLVGLSLSYVLPITGLLSGLLSALAETEQEMVAAERVFQYLQLGGASSESAQSPCSGCSEGAQRRPPAPPRALLGSSGAAPDLEAQRQPLLRAPSDTAPPHEAAPSRGWIHSGHVRFEDVRLRYEPWRGGSSAAGGSGGSGGSPAPAAATVGAAEEHGSGGSSDRPWVLRGVSLDIQPGRSGDAGRLG